MYNCYPPLPISRCTSNLITHTNKKSQNKPRTTKRKTPRNELISVSFSRCTYIPTTKRLLQCSKIVHGTINLIIHQLALRGQGQKEGQKRARQKWKIARKLLNKLYSLFLYSECSFLHLYTFKFSKQLANPGVTI